MSKRTVWFEELDKRRIELLKEGYSYSTVAKILNKEFGLNLNKDSIANRCKATNTTKTELMSNQLKLFSVNKEEKMVKKIFPEEAYYLDEDLTFTPEKKRRLKAIWESFNDGKPKKILSLSDLHAPYIDFKAVEKAILSHLDADILVLNGDVFDGHALSDFDKLDDFDIEIEFQQVFLFLNVVTKMFKKIYWVGGNHDFSRFIRMVARKFGNGMKKYVLKRLNPVEYIAEKYDNVYVVPHQFMQIGKCIFVHPDRYSSALMSTALKQAEIFLANKEELLPYPEFQALVQGHTHDLGEYYFNGIKIIEQGYLSHIQDYRFDNPTKRRNTQGYAVVYLDENGNVDFNKTRNYIIERN